MLLKSGLPEGPATSFFKLSSFVYTISLLYLIVTLKQKYRVKKANVLSYLGSHSYGIYFVHPVILVITNKTVQTLAGGLERCLPLYHLITISITLAASCVVIIIARKVLKDKASVLGF